MCADAQGVLQGLTRGRAKEYLVLGLIMVSGGCHKTDQRVEHTFRDSFWPILLARPCRVSVIGLGSGKGTSETSCLELRQRGHGPRINSERTPSLWDTDVVREVGIKLDDTGVGDGDEKWEAENLRVERVEVF